MVRARKRTTPWNQKLHASPYRIAAHRKPRLCGAACYKRSVIVRQARWRPHDPPTDHAKCSFRMKTHTTTATSLRPHGSHCALCKRLFVSFGASSMLLDCIIEDGNPADSTLAITRVDRHIERHSAAPRQAAFDGGFASQANLRGMKDRGVEDVMFSKTCGLDPAEMVSSSVVFKALRNFRAGVEACISFLKCRFGMGRWHWPAVVRAWFRSSPSAVRRPNPPARPTRLAGPGGCSLAQIAQILRDSGRYWHVRTGTS